MKYLSLLAMIMVGLLACSGPKKEQDPESEKPQVEETDKGLVNIVTNSMDIVMPDTLHSGLNHLVYENRSNMVHLLLFNKVPDTITVQTYAEQLTKPFQEVMDAITAGVEPPNNFPAWLAAMVNHGGVGLLSPGRTGESFVNLTPGNYVVECYIKSNGVFHSSTGMLKRVTVIDENTGVSDPGNTLDISLSPAGIVMMGEIPAGGGSVTFKVSHGETKLFDNFTRPDVNLAKIEEESDLAALEDYMDWRKPNGMVIEAPVVFMGGVQEMPEGNASYFSVDLDPGRYVLIGEVPKPKEDAFYVEFEVK